MTSYTHGAAITCFRVFQRPATGQRSITMTSGGGTDYPIWWENDNKIYVANSGRFFSSTSANTNTGYFLLRSSWTSTSTMALWLNGVSVAGSISGTLGSALAWTLYGKGSTEFNNGNVLEDIVFPTALTAGDIASMESYLNSKWAVY